MSATEKEIQQVKDISAALATYLDDNCSNNGIKIAAMATTLSALVLTIEDATGASVEQVLIEHQRAVIQYVNFTRSIGNRDYPLATPPTSAGGV